MHGSLFRSHVSLIRGCIVSREDVLKGFTDSQEFANLCGAYDILPNLA